MLAVSAVDARFTAIVFVINPGLVGSNFTALVGLESAACSVSEAVSNSGLLPNGPAPDAFCIDKFACVAVNASGGAPASVALAPMGCCSVLLNSACVPDKSLENDTVARITEWPVMSEPSADALY